MGKSCSKQGHLDIDYDTMTSRAEPEGQCLSPIEPAEVRGHGLISDTEGVSALVKHVEEETSFCKVKGRYFTSTSPSLQPTARRKLDALRETDIIVDLPPETDSVSKGMEWKETPIIRDCATQTSRSVIQDSCRDGPVLNGDVTSVSNVNSEASGLRSTTSLDQEKWSYTLYDFEGRGNVGKNDLSQLVQSLYTVVGHSISKDVFKMDKENLARKLRMDKSRSQGPGARCLSRWKNSGKGISKTSFPPPESEEAEKLSSYIEEKLRVSKRLKGPRNTNAHNARHCELGIPGRAGCTFCKGDERPLLMKNSPLHRRHGISQSACSRGDKMSRVIKDRRTIRSKRHDGCVDDVPRQSCPTFDSPRVSNISAEQTDDIGYRATVPRRQETYPGACSDSENEVQVSRSRDIDCALRISEVRSTSRKPRDSAQGRGSANEENSDTEKIQFEQHCSDQVQRCCDVAFSERTIQNSHWPEEIDPGKIRDLCRLSPKVEASDKFYRSYENHPGKESSQSAKCFHQKERPCLSNRLYEPGKLCCGSTNLSQRDETQSTERALSECDSSCSVTNQTVSSYITTVGEAACGEFGKPSMPSCHSCTSEEWPVEMCDGQPIRSSKTAEPELSCPRTFSSDLPVFPDNDRALHQDGRKTRCPCQFRASQSKRAPPLRLPLSSRQSDLQHHHLPHKMEPTCCVSRAGSHPVKAHSPPSNQENPLYERQTLSSLDSSRVEHVCRHEHYHYHYYIDKLT